MHIFVIDHWLAHYDYVVFGQNGTNGNFWLGTKIISGTKIMMMIHGCILTYVDYNYGSSKFIAR